jgi:phage tail-like protein
MTYPLPVFHFQVDWGGTRMGFSEVSGLDVEVQPIEYREGNSPSYSTMKMPGLPKYGNITLKRGVMPKDNEFFDWLDTARLNKVERRDITISLLDEDHEPVMVWMVKNAWVTKLTGPLLNATANEVAIESMEIAHDGLTVASP